jgi:2-polyprenyl-3-methyl-5-hydroxy-6-metoxy-1,4-benzoquinol methylase
MDSVLRSSIPREELTETFCPVCGDERRQHVRDEREFPVWRCASCRHMYVSPRPSKAWLKRYYTECWQPENEVKRSEIYDVAVRAVNSCLSTRGDLLDVGMGAGGLLDRAALDGWRIHGIEADNKTYETALAHFGKTATLYNGMFETVDLPPSSFDCIVMINVIEHVIEPKDIFRRAHELLRPGGCLAVRYPDCRRFLAAPAHLHNFTRTSATKLFHSTGFTDVRFFYASTADFSDAPWRQRVTAQLVRTAYRTLMCCTAGNISLPFVSQLAVGRVPPASR